MVHLGATLTAAKPGEVEITVVAADTLQQQHGFFHAGVTTAIADSAAGYAAFTLFSPDAGVLTTELKINLLNPAKGERLVAKGRVIKCGKTLSVCQADVYGVVGDAADDDGAEGDVVHVATALLTMIQVPGAG
jgi:uncharacterized protein (TIGR00369 family)